MEIVRIIYSKIVIITLVRAVKLALTIKTLYEDKPPVIVVGTVRKAKRGWEIYSRLALRSHISSGQKS